MKVLAGGIGVNYVKCEKCGRIKSFLKIGPLPQRGMKRDNLESVVGSANGASAVFSFPLLLFFVLLPPKKDNRGIQTSRKAGLPKKKKGGE